MSLTSQLVAQTAITTLMVTHSMQQALDYGDRIVMFHRGKIVLDVDGTERAALTVNDLLPYSKKHLVKSYAMTCCCLDSSLCKGGN